MKKLLLIDGSSYLYRAFHAMAPLTSPQGEPTGALFGVLNMLRRLRSQTADYELCAVIFDAKGKNFRHELYPEYKANRPPMPDDLRAQAVWVREMTELFGWNVIAIEGVEADDVIATLARRAESAGMNVLLSSGDKDLMQLVNNNITVIDTMKNATYDIDGVFAKFGVYPHQIVDYLTLIGDTADNIKGVEKCGPKTATKWLTQYESLDNLINHATEITGKVGENLRNSFSQINLSRQLILLKDDVNLSNIMPNGWEDLHSHEPDWQKLLPRLQYFGFRSWIKEAEKYINTANNNSLDLFDSLPENNKTHDLFNSLPENNMQQTSFRQTIQSMPNNYKLVSDIAGLNALCERLTRVNQIGFDTETTSLKLENARIVGMSFAFDDADAVYVPVAHAMTIMPSELNEEIVLSTLKPFLENHNLKKIGQNLKYDRHVLSNHNIELAGITGDAMLASYILESHLGHGLDELALRHLNIETIKYEDLCGKGVKAISFADVELNDACKYACQDADLALRLEKHLFQLLNDEQRILYKELELPVADILYRMERYGTLIDCNLLHEHSMQLGKSILQLENEAYTAAGQTFNLNSPKQLQEILFQKLAIPTRGIKKTTHGFSTNEEVLEKLSLDYPLPRIILESRTLSKLKSTYTDKLPQIISPKDGRIHTTYAQAVAVTGRLSSNNPNLQNIPARTQEGRKIRTAFIAPSDHVIVCADYSQIELRIMAHLSEDPTLIDAFNHGEDIHKRTAADIFGINVDSVTAEQRRYAKTINFGLIYGMSEYGLARSLNISNIEAKDFITRYFARYPSVASYMESTKQLAREMGYVETLFGRRLYLPDINSSNGNRRIAAERSAINAPMQGTAADIVKRAMINVDNFLISGRLQSHLIMQVHDELVFEVPKSEQQYLVESLPKLMSEVANLSIPLIADIGVGENWEIAH